MPLALVEKELISASCSHFGICGGCRFQTTSYEKQLEQKQEFVKNLFKEFGADFFPIIPCESPWHYRNKMEFSFSQSRTGERFLGLMMRAKRGKVVNLTMCELTNPWFIEVITIVREWWEEAGLDAYYPPADRGSLRTLTLREGVRTGEKMVVLTVSGKEEFALSEAQIQFFVEKILKSIPVDSIVLRKQILAKKMPTRFEEQVLFGKDSIQEILFGLNQKPFIFKIRPSSFFQPNTRQAEKLYKRGLQLAELNSQDVLFDLYCGTGSIGLFASSYVGKVWGIELNSDAVRDAKENICYNRVTNMEVYEGDVGSLLPAEMRPTTIVIDPPRAGLSPNALKNLIELNPQKILYISCNPETQYSNILELNEKGYVPIAIQPVDQFPHTPHIENIVALVRSF